MAYRRQAYRRLELVSVRVREECFVKPRSPFLSYISRLKVLVGRFMSRFGSTVGVKVRVRVSERMTAYRRLELVSIGVKVGFFLVWLMIQLLFRNCLFLFWAGLSMITSVSS